MPQPLTKAPTEPHARPAPPARDDTPLRFTEDVADIAARHDLTKVGDGNWAGPGFYLATIVEWARFRVVVSVAATDDRDDWHVTFAAGTPAYAVDALLVALAQAAS